MDSIRVERRRCLWARWAPFVVALLASATGREQTPLAARIRLVPGTGLSTCYELEGELPFCLPYIFAVGVGKAGSSALWYKLRAHHQVCNKDRKEWCPTSTVDPGAPKVLADYSLEDVLKWAVRMNRLGNMTVDAARAGAVLLSTCMNPNALRVLREELGHRNTIALVMVRDLPHWLYSVYLHFCPFPDQYDCRPVGERAPIDTPDNPRSARAFHQHVLEREDWGTAHERDDLWQYGIRKLRGWVERVGATVDPGRLLVLANHDLLERPLETLRAIERFAGLEGAQYDPELLAIIVNSKHHHGVKAVMTEEEVEAADKEYGANSVLLPQTYEILRDRWRDDCLWFKDQWQLCFTSCCQPT